MTIQNLKLKVLANFPTSVNGTNGLAVTKQNGIWTVGPAFDQLALVTSLTSVGTNEVWIRDPTSGTYSRVALQALVTALGQTGGAIAIGYTFDSNIADADPGAGKLRLNSATQ